MTTGIIYHMTAAILNLQRDRGLRKGARMERLTFVTEDGEVLFHPEDLPDDEGVTITQLAVARRFRALETIAERLANREQAEEQGLLLRLPCKVGDKLYRITPYAKEPIITTHVLQINIKQFFNEKIIVRIDVMDKMGESCYFLDDIGKKVFLSRAEAEAKLAEMEGAE